jgi:hypothetical protein
LNEPATNYVLRAGGSFCGLGTGDARWPLRHHWRPIGVKAARYLMIILGSAAVAAAVALHSVLSVGVIVDLAVDGGMSLSFGLGWVAVARRRDRATAGIARVTVTGLSGSGTITSVAATQLSENPRCLIQLNVTLPDRLVYQATVTRDIARTDMPRYQPGCAFPVRVDPDDLSAVVLIDSSGITWASSRAEVAPGVTGTAVVTGLFEPAAAGIDEPLWGLTLRVQAEDGRPRYDVRLATVRPEGISRPRRGDRVGRVWIDPEDPRHIAVDWASLPDRPDGAGHRLRAVRL